MQFAASHRTCRDQKGLRCSSNGAAHRKSPLFFGSILAVFRLSQKQRTIFLSEDELARALDYDSSPV
jgi:hypothetical protein